LYQFLEVDLPFTQANADQIFLDILTRDEFAPRKLYYTAVRTFGGMFRHFTHWKRSYSGRSVRL